MNATQKLYASMLAIFTNFYDLYINPTPKMVTLKNAKVNEDGTVDDVTLENMAKVKENFEEWKASVGTGTQQGDYATLPVKFFTIETINNIHIKTDIHTTSNCMCAIKIEGYAYRIAKSINTICSAYNYNDSHVIINKDTINDDKITSDFYWSRDGFLCLRLTSVIDFYFTTLRVTPILVGHSGVYAVTAIINQKGDL